MLWTIRDHSRAYVATGNGYELRYWCHLKFKNGVDDE